MSNHAILTLVFLALAVAWLYRVRLARWLGPTPSAYQPEEEPEEEPWALVSWHLVSTGCYHIELANGEQYRGGAWCRFPSGESVAGYGLLWRELERLEQQIRWGVYNNKHRCPACGAVGKRTQLGLCGDCKACC